MTAIDHPRAAVCADIGSTYTKGALVDVETGALLAIASHRTTIDTDVLDGLDAVRAELARLAPTAAVDDVLVCSSAGGGLRLAVVGYERAVTAEAGHRVGLSAGARVVHVAAGELDPSAVADLLAATPDLVLLVGGTDGGNSAVLEHNARQLAASALLCPVVVAGNVEARDVVVAALDAQGKTALPTENVLPRIGFLDPLPARETIRDVFIKHVIGGKRLTRRGAELERLVRAATPDAVLVGVELLADGTPDVPGIGDVLVVDIGGATTDVYSVLVPDPEEASLHREIVETSWRGRTVEGDLGVRWNAPGVVEAAVVERLLTAAQGAELTPGAAVRAANPGYLPGADAAGADTDQHLAALAATIAVRRHSRPQAASAAGAIRRGGRDLRQVRLVVGSGGVLRHAPPSRRTRVLEAVIGDTGGGWQVPEHPRLVVDRSYVLAAAGLLTLSGRASAGARLLQAHLR